MSVLNDEERFAVPTRSSAQLMWKRLTEAQQDDLLGRPVYTPDETRGFLKPALGMELEAEKVFEGLEARPEIALALRLDVVQMRKDLAASAELSHLEETTHNLYRRAIENRMKHDNDLYRGLLKLNRFMQTVAEPDLARDFSSLTEWVAANHSHGPATESGGSAPEKKSASTEKKSTSDDEKTETPAKS